MLYLTKKIPKPNANKPIRLVKNCFSLFLIAPLFINKPNTRAPLLSLCYRTTNDIVFICLAFFSTLLISFTYLNCTHKNKIFVKLFDRISEAPNTFARHFLIPLTSTLNTSGMSEVFKVLTRHLKQTFNKPVVCLGLLRLTFHRSVS